MLLEFYNCSLTSLSGQRSADDEPAAKKPKMSLPKKQDPPEKPKTEQRPTKVPADQPNVSYSVSDVSTPLQTSSVEDKSSTVPVVMPAVSSVTISRRDPRTAGHRSSTSLAQTEPDVSMPVGAPVSVPVVTPLPPEAPVVDTKGPLPMPPPAPVALPKPVMPKQDTSTESRHYGASASR